MIFQLSLTNPPQVLKEGDHPSFQLKQAKKIDKERGHVDASMKGAQHVKLRGSDSLLKKIQNEKKVLDEVFGNLADPTMKGSIINRGKINHLTFFHILKRKENFIYQKNYRCKTNDPSWNGFEKLWGSSFKFDATQD